MPNPTTAEHLRRDAIDKLHRAMAAFQSDMALTAKMAHTADYLSLADTEASLRNLIPELHALVGRAKTAADAAHEAEVASDRRHAIVSPARMNITTERFRQAARAEGCDLPSLNGTNEIGQHDTGAY